MLPKTIDNESTHLFMASHQGGFDLVFASRKAFDQGGPVQALWVRGTADARTLLALQRWVAVRRGLWEAWGRLAEAIGQAAFVDHMETLLSESPIGEAMGTVVTPLPADDRGMTLGQMLSGHQGLRLEVLHRHRFGSAKLRERFFDWLHTDDNVRAAEELVHIGFCAGTDAVAELLDRIATELPKLAPASTEPPLKARSGRRRR